MRAEPISIFPPNLNSQAVFNLKLNAMSRIDVRLFGERRTFQEAIVTIVSSTDPTRWPCLEFSGALCPIVTVPVYFDVCCLLFFIDNCSVWFIEFLLGEGEVQFPDSQSCLGRPFSWGEFSFFIAESSGTTSVISLYFKLKMWSQKSRFKTRGTARKVASSWTELLCALTSRMNHLIADLPASSKHISASFHTCYCQSQFRVMGAS